MSTVAEFTVTEGQTVPFSLAWYPANETPPRPVDAAYAIADTEQWWTEWVRQCTYERRVPRRGGPLADHPEGADLRAHRRDRGRRHHVPARDAGREPQLGLPVLLAARRHLHPRVAHAGRLLRGGDGVAATGCCGPSPGTRRRSRSCTAPAASGGSTSGRSTGCPATRGRRRCASATPPPASSSSTSTARSCPPCTSRPAGRAPSDGASWELQLALMDFLETAGASPTTGSGRCAAPGATSPTPR